ncbi:MAG: hypothetical protein QM739_20490 [Propionivibrio sp.]
MGLIAATTFSEKAHIFERSLRYRHQLPGATSRIPLPAPANSRLCCERLETVFTKHAFNSYFFSVLTPIFLHHLRQPHDTKDRKHRKNKHFLQIQSAFVTHYHKIVNNGTANLCDTTSTGGDERNFENLVIAFTNQL